MNSNLSMRSMKQRTRSSRINHMVGYHQSSLTVCPVVRNLINIAAKKEIS